MQRALAATRKRHAHLLTQRQLEPPKATVGRQSVVRGDGPRRDMAAPADQVFGVVLVGVAARSQGRQVHLVNGCRGDGCRWNAEFGGDRGDRVLGDVEVHPTVAGEIRADVALIVLLRFLAGQPAQERGDVADG